MFKNEEGKIYYKDVEIDINEDENGNIFFELNDYKNVYKSEEKLKEIGEEFARYVEEALTSFLDKEKQ